MFRQMFSLALLIVTALGASLWSSQAHAQDDNTQILFTMGQLEVFARQDDTTVRITNLINGEEFTTFTLDAEGDRFSRTSGIPRYIAVTTDKPVTLFTGKALPGRNDWSSVMNADNNTEFGRRFHGFTEHFLWVFVPRLDGDLAPTSITITDLSDGDDSRTLTSDDATLNNGRMEIYELSGFENDSLIVECSRPCVTQVGSSSIKSSTGWSFTPPSVAPGEDGRELGTNFVFFANPDLTIWPFSDDTVVEILDLSDGDDTRTVRLNADQFFSLRNLSSVMRGERELVHGGNNLFDADFVEIRSNRPVLTFVGPNFDPGGGFTLDFAPTVATGPARQEAFVYANNIGIELLTFDRETNATLRTVSGNAVHDLTIAPDDWEGVGPFFFEAPFNWSRELVHVVSDRPTVIFYGDFQESSFGACCSASFVPVIPPTRLLPPVAEAGVSILACPFDTIEVDASASFDPDGLGDPPGIVAYAWDFDTATNSDGVGGTDDDVDATDVVSQHTYPSSGTYQMRLSVTDNEGEQDDDFVLINIDVSQLELCGEDNDDDDVGAFNDNCPETFNPDQADLDDDDIGDACDDDIDGDGVLNDNDNCPLINNDDQDNIDNDDEGDACDDDIDGDDVLNDDDNCPLTSNTEQTDIDEDNIGDACDEDIDGDDVLNDDDNCPLTPNTEQDNNDNDDDGDACDDDDDNDGVSDDDDNCQFIANDDQDNNDNDDDGDACDDDDDNDGVLDFVDNCPFTQNPRQLDSDNDDTGDACDDDDDNDGVSDDDDNCQFIANNDQANNDGDDEGDVCDDDDDNDGVSDDDDNCQFIANDDQRNTDLDRLGDACDDDDDNDGVSDDDDNCPLVNNPDQDNIDDDFQGDACDEDADGDDVLDDDDNCPLDANPQQDNNDDDDLGDACDPDDDNDGVLDDSDNCPLTPNLLQLDLDQDNVGDACDDDDDGDGVGDDDDNCPLVDNPGQEDRDDDNIGDACEADDDGDTVPNDDDNCPQLANADQADNDDDGDGDACDDDDDDDGVSDDDDNCPQIANDDQLDTDDDGDGDACDDDDDDDTIDDDDDNCPLVDNTDQANNDMDALGDACDDDDDNDAVDDDDDNCPNSDNPEQIDLDGDGAGDACDDDDDDDDLDDDDDNCPGEPNEDQTDTDEDGAGDACDDDDDDDNLSDDEEVAIGTDPTLPDTDGDGIDDGVEVFEGTDPLDDNNVAVNTAPADNGCDCAQVSPQRPGQPWPWALTLLFIAPLMLRRRR